MDRNLALALLAFDRPGGAGELPPADRVALNEAVAADPALADYARRRAAEDAALVAAMTAVPVPTDAKSRALGRLLARRASRHAAPAGLGSQSPPPPCSPSACRLASHTRCGRRSTATPSPPSTSGPLKPPSGPCADFLAGRGLPADLPLELDFSKYLQHATQRLEGRDVPVVTFVTPRPGGGSDTLWLYVVTDRQFRVENLKAAQASLCTTAVFDDPRAPHILWVAVTTTGSVEPFLKPPREFGMQ